MQRSILGVVRNFIAWLRGHNTYRVPFLSCPLFAKH